MQQRGLNVTPPMMMENEVEETTPPQPPPPPALLSSRGRVTSKLKVLVRCHAMREEASPPREPISSPPNNTILTSSLSPAIKVIPSSEEFYGTEVHSSSGSVLLSPSLSRGNSPSSQRTSPTSTLVAISPQSSPRHMHNDDISEDDDDTMNKENLEKDTTEKDSSQTINNISNSNNKKKILCDCATQQNSCVKCGRSQERNINNNLTNNINNNTLTVKSNCKGKLRQQSSSQGSFEGSSSNSPCLSRDSSSEQQYTDTSGINLELFIPETLNRNAKDRAFMLRIEQELVSLAKDKIKTHYKFPPMSSYQRMLVHRCAAYFGMEHNIESSGKCVVVNKTKNTRIPDVEFKEHIKEDVVFSEEPRRSILKRDSNSIEDYNFKSPDRQFLLENRRSKSFEEREEEYEKARRRIFNREMRDGGSHEDYEWAELPWSSTDSDNSSRFRLQPPELNRRHMGKLTKVLSEETGETLRPHVAKSYSFGGYGGVLNRGDSVVSTHSAGPRLLTKQDSAASSVSWRLSPSSSGYKSQSQMSESVTPSPTSTPHPICEGSRQDSNCSDSHDKSSSGGDSVVWAVSDIQSVPKGSLIINPQTGDPITNDDGSLYHYDPNNLPSIFMKPPPSPKKSTSSPSSQIIKDRSQSPNMKKRSSNNNNTSRYTSGRKSHVTNSSTSPSLPYSPPSLPQLPTQNNRNFHFVGGENLQQFPVYGTGFTPQNPHESVPVYQPPCIVYTTPYGIPVSPHFDGRMEQPIADLGNTYFLGIPESASQSAQTLTYQQPPYWNQQPVSYFQNNPTPPQRFSVPIHQQGQPGYLPSPNAFPPNYLPQPPPGSHQLPPPPSTQNVAADLVTVFPHQQVQVVYQPNQTNPVMFPNNIVYAQNPIYPTQYPQNTSTPNSCASSVSHSTFTEQNHHGMLQLTQNMAQMSFVNPPPLQQPTQQQTNYKMAPPVAQQSQQQQHYNDNNNAGNKYAHPMPPTKGFMLSSSQSSTGTSSPAATVVPCAGYPPQGNPQMFRASPDAPSPSQFAYAPNFHQAHHHHLQQQHLHHHHHHQQMPPMFYRQMSNHNNNRIDTPGTTRNSRSPTPASDNISNLHFDKQRIPLPPSTLYHGMPYVLQSPDSRVVSHNNRGPPNNPYRHPPPSIKQQNFGQNQENRSHNNKNRKSKGGKVSGAHTTANSKPPV